jgi:hypothetical protein
VIVAEDPRRYGVVRLDVHRLIATVRWSGDRPRLHKAQVAIDETRAPKWSRTMSYLDRSNYHPGRGGHAPGDLRDAFAEAVEDYIYGGSPEPFVDVRGHKVSLHHALRPAVELFRRHARQSAR